VSKRTNLPKDTALTVYAHNHKSVEVMLRKFKKKVQQSGVIDEYKERQAFTKKSVTKRREKQLAAYNARNKNS
jgi:small subunit ribosomal protein S21